MDARQKVLIELASGGDTAAFGELYEFYYKEMYHYSLYILNNTSLAQDAVQDTALNAFEQISTLRKPQSFKFWIFKILSNNCKRLLKEKGKDRLLVPIEDAYDLSSDEGDISFPLEIEVMLGKLNPDEKSIVLLSIFLGYKSHEIADILDCPSATVRSRLSRALKKLRTSEEGKKELNRYA